MDIKPCPFCGRLELSIQYGTTDREGTPHNIICEDCGATGPWYYLSRDVDDIQYVATVTQWNERKVGR